MTADIINVTTRINSRTLGPFCVNGKGIRAYLNVPCAERMEAAKSRLSKKRLKISAVTSKRVGGEIVYGRTPLGQAVYDVHFSAMSAAEVARRHRGVTREFVIDQRRNHPIKGTRYWKGRKRR